MLPRAIQKLIDEFSRLPGIGSKSAQRLAMHLLRTSELKSRNLGEALLGMRKNVQFCQVCWNISDQDICHFCNDSARDQSLLCVVEDVLDVIAIEKTSKFKGVYHVLHGALSPINGIGSEDLKLAELFSRIQGTVNSDSPINCEPASEMPTNGLSNNATEKGKINEIILATNPGLEGEATAMYIQRELSSSPIKITRIAQGLPIGADLEYADKDTLTKAIEGRREY